DTSGGGGSAGGSVGLAGGGSAGARAAAASGRAGGGGSGPAPNANISCPGKNGGSTDVGVDGGNVHLAATVVQSGIGRSFLGPVENGLFAVQQKTNRSGGGCGRQMQ